MRGKEWDRSPKGKFTSQRKQALRRGIEWHFTFEEWMKVWEDSGKWEQRGSRKGQYVMCRKGDIGPYSPENVFIDLTENNVKQGQMTSGNVKGAPISENKRRARSENAKRMNALKWAPENREKSCEEMRGIKKTLTDEQRQTLRENGSARLRDYNINQRWKKED